VKGDWRTRERGPRRGLAIDPGTDSIGRFTIAPPCWAFSRPPVPILDDNGCEVGIGGIVIDRTPQQVELDFCESGMAGTPGRQWIPTAARATLAWERWPGCNG
jgi:hypothetical protein